MDVDCSATIWMGGILVVGLDWLACGFIQLGWLVGLDIHLDMLNNIGVCICLDQVFRSVLNISFITINLQFNRD